MEGFEMSTQRSATVEMAASRQVQEVQGQIIMAKRFPRNYAESCKRIMQACQRKGLAEKAEYEYVKGGSKINGPSIRLAEMLAQNWGNVSFGIVELEQKHGSSQVMAFCWDLETNTRQEKIFSVPHMRHTSKGDYPLTDPREIYEMVANQGARRLRSCILGIIPGDVQEDAVAKCRETLEKDAQEPVEDMVNKVVAALRNDFSVPPEALEKYIGYKIEAFTIKDVSKLKRAYMAIKDGMTSAEELFKLPKAEKESEVKNPFEGKDKPKTDKAEQTEPVHQTLIGGDANAKT